MGEKVVERYVIFKGKVQGVSFRYYTQSYATDLKLVGTVKNLPDGTVEMVAQGRGDQIDKLIKILSGPSGPGRVSAVEAEEREVTESFGSFQVVF